MKTLVELCFHSIISVENFIQLNGDGIKALPLELLQRLLQNILISVQSKLLTQTIALKIRLIRQNRLVTFRFQLHATVEETVKYIYERLGGSGTDETDSVQNYGLFFRDGPYQRSCWLKNNRTLSYYDLKPGDILDFKIKQTLLKVQFLGPWPTVKTFIVDESKTVAELTLEIGKKLAIKNPEEFSLQVVREYDKDEVSAWLNPHESLPEQGVDTLCTTLLLRKKYFFKDYGINEVSDNQQSLNSVFCQNLDAVIAGTNPCTLEEMAKLVALQCQIRFGDCDSNSPSFFETMSWQDYLPQEYVTSHKKIEKEILAEYKALNSLSDVNGKYRFLQQTKSLKTYGYTFFRVQKFCKEQQQQQVVLLGVSKQNILILDADTKSTLYSKPLTEIVMWKVFHHTLYIYCLEQTDEYYTKEAKEISQVISDYVDSNLSDRIQEEQKTFESRGSALSPKLKDRLRHLLAVTKSSSLDDLGLLPNPNLKKSPLYINPNKVVMNPLFAGGSIQPSKEPTYEVNYIVKVIRSLSCLRTSLGSQIRERVIKVKFPDKAIKAFTVDETKTVYDIALEIGDQVGIKNPEEFSLQKDESDVWLNPYQPLCKQGLTDTDTLVFKKKFHYNDAFVNTNDPVYFNLLFCQLRDAITSGLYPCDISEAVQLAATQFQINFGDHNPSIHKPGFLQYKDLKFFLPPECLEYWGVTFQKLEKMIYREHQKLRGIKEEYAKFRYLQLCRNLRAYGTVCFQVKLSSHKGKVHPNFPSTGFMLGFSRDSFLLLTLKTKKVLADYPLCHLRRWEGTSTTFTLDFGDYPEGCFIFKTLEGEIISKYLSDYIDFIAKTTMATQTFNTDICSYPQKDTTKNFFLSDSNSMFCWENGKRVFTSSFDNM